MFDFEEMANNERKIAHERFNSELNYENLDNMSEAQKLYLSFFENIYPGLVRDMVKMCFINRIFRLPVNEEYENELDKSLENVFMGKKYVFKLIPGGDRSYIDYSGNEIFVHADETVGQDFLYNYMGIFCKKHNFGYYYETMGYPFMMTLEGHYKELKEWYSEELQELSMICDNQDHKHK